MYKLKTRDCLTRNLVVTRKVYSVNLIDHLRKPEWHIPRNEIDLQGDILALIVSIQKLHTLEEL